LVRILNYEGFRIFDFGIFLPFIGVIAQKFGINVTCRVSLEKPYPNECYIIESVDLIRKIVLEDCKKTLKYEPIYDFYNAILKILNFEGKIFFHQPYSPPSFKEIQNALKKGPVIVLVSGRDYYKINEDWFHTLVLISTDDEKFCVLDCYEDVGYKEYPNWKEHLENAKRYNWMNWKGGLIEFG
jgi:hypothetical protein